MGILDGIVEWIAEQVMAGLDLITTSVLGALGCDMAVFLRYFPAAETMYSVFVALGIGIILLNWVWQLFKNFGLGAGIEAEDPLKLSIRSVIFILLAFFSNEIVSMILTIVFGVGFGVLMAVGKDRLPDHVLGTFSTVALSVPGFWIAIVLIFIFAEQWKILPSSGISDGSGFILPAVTLALPSIGVCARLTRSAILDEIGRQYMTVADAKGMSRRRAVVRHAFGNALIPIITYLGTHMAGIIGGASIVETIFAIPGIGSYAIAGVQSKDYYVVQAYVLFSGCIYVLTNILIDLIYIALDPKIRAGEAVES